MTQESKLLPLSLLCGSSLIAAAIASLSGRGESTFVMLCSLVVGGVSLLAGIYAVAGTLNPVTMFHRGAYSAPDSESVGGTNGHAAAEI